MLRHRASIMPGEYAGGRGIYDFAAPLTPSQQQRRAYWSQMKGAGYHIGFIGKYGVGNEMPQSAFDVWNGFPGQVAYFPQGPHGPHLNHIMRDQASILPFHQLEGAACAGRIARSVPAIKGHGSTLCGHHRSAATGAPASDINRFPPEIQHSENRRRWGVRFATPRIYQDSMHGYYRLITGIDDVVGSLRATLDKMGIADNTIIVYSADHGIFNANTDLPENGMATRNRFEFP